MKVLWLLFLSLASQSEALQRLSWFGKKWKSQIWNDDLDSGLNPRNTIMRAKPKVFKNLLGLKAQSVFLLYIYFIVVLICYHFGHFFGAKLGNQRFKNKCSQTKLWSKI